jgi:hypothetical protein
MMDRSNHVFLFLSHSVSAQIIREYGNISSAIAGMGSSVFLYHDRRNETPPSLPRHKLYLFSDESLSNLNYLRIGPSLVPGHNQFPLLQFFRDNPNFDHYWVIEYDVRFSGDWHFFFDYFKDTKQDFLTCHIRDHAREPDFFWWSLHHPRKSIPLSERLRSFNPIYRLSNASLSFLHHSLSDGWCGHHEVLFPTLLHHSGFTIMDIGGKGRFTPPDLKDRFYTDSNFSGAYGWDCYGALDSGTMRYRPSFWRFGQEKNKLYHPVKPFVFVIREKINNQKCKRWLPGRLRQAVSYPRRYAAALGQLRRVLEKKGLPRKSFGSDDAQSFHGRFLRSANFWSQNCAILRNAPQTWLVRLIYEKHAAQRYEKMRNSLGLN